jgi:hypothetical protein
LLLIGWDIRFRENSFHWTFWNTSLAVDAIGWVDVNHLVIDVKAFNRTNGYAVSVSAIVASLGHYMSHGSISFQNTIWI